MTLTFKIQIRGIKKPPVWRRIEIPADFTFHNLHHVIQAAFGWMDYHMYTFEKQPFGDGWVVKVPDEYDDKLDNPVIDSRRTAVQEFLTRKRMNKLVYVYDYGDSWVHDVTLESINPERELPHPICLGGKGACPPEDCGGSYGYEEIKRLFDEEPDSEETQEYREWLGLREGDVFDPNEFRLDKVNTRLSKIVSKTTKKQQKSKSQAGPKHIRLYDTVNKLRKDEVIDNAEDLGLDVEPSLKVKAVKEQYAQQVLAHPREVLCQLPLQDLMIIQKLKEGTDGANIVDVYEDYFQPLLLPMGLAQEWRDGEVYYLHFGDDFRDAVTPLIDEVMDDLEVHARVTMESFIEGMANLYGVVNHVTVRKEMVRLGMTPSVEAADHLLKEVWQHSLLLKWIVTGSDILDNGPDSRSLYCSRFGWNDPFSLIDQLDSQGKGFRKFSEMEIVMASRNPMPVIPNPMQEKFEAMLADRLHLSEWETMQVCHDLWLFAMHEGDDEYKGCEPKRYFEDCVLNVLETEGQLRDEALRMVDDYLSHMPHWQLQGHAPADMEALPDRQQTQAGPVLPPTLPGGITPDPLWQAMPYFAPPKVGRNDPCPCGSGKKYKHCCGRGN